MRRSIATLFCFFLALVSQSAGATNYHVYRKFEPVCHDNELKRCNHHRCTSAHMDLTQDISPDARSPISAAIAVAGGIDTGSGPHRQSDPSAATAPHPESHQQARRPVRGNRRWQRLARLARYSAKEFGGGCGQSRVHHRSEGQRREQPDRENLRIHGARRRGARLARSRRAASSAAPEVADPDLTFVLPIRFAAGKKH